MIAREPLADGDSPAHLLIAIFSVLVAVILRAVTGWSAPLHAWIVLAALVDALLVAHAGVRAMLLAARRHWRDALRALSLAAALGVTAVVLMTLGHAHPITLEDAPVDDASSTAAGAR